MGTDTHSCCPCLRGWPNPSCSPVPTSSRSGQGHSKQSRCRQSLLVSTGSRLSSRPGAQQHDAVPHSQAAYQQPGRRGPRPGPSCPANKQFGEDIASSVSPSRVPTSSGGVEGHAQAQTVNAGVPRVQAVQQAHVQHGLLALPQHLCMQKYIDWPVQSTLLTRVALIPEAPQLQVQGCSGERVALMHAAGAYRMLQLGLC